MSTTTDVLSLFKYDPVADADSTFNITQALNNNWDKLDAAILLAIAAAGAYNPEESYAVGDYCTYKGKLRKCSTAIPTGEAWTEAHWTTTTVAAEMAELSSQLSNKQDQIWLGVAETDADLNDLKQIGTISVHGTCTNMPPDTLSYNWGLLTVSANTEDGGIACTQRLSILVVESWEPILYERNWNGINWSKWARIATATPPQEFDLPLADGITALKPCTYYKNQFGEVTLGGCTSGSVSDGATIATLPTGFRPDHPVERPATFTASGNRYAGSVFIAANGIVSIHTPAAATNVVFAASFLAKN